MRLLNPIALVLVIVGALNWGLVGLFEFDLVAEITGDTFGETNASPVVPSTEDGARASAVATGGRLRARVGASFAAGRQGTGSHSPSSVAGRPYFASAEPRSSSATMRSAAPTASEGGFSRSGREALSSSRRSEERSRSCA